MIAGRLPNLMISPVFGNRPATISRTPAGEVLAVVVVVPGVARAPDMAGVGTVLHRAVEMGAHGGEGAQLARRRPNDDRRTVAELEDLPRVRQPSGDHRSDAGGRAARLL